MRVSYRRGWEGIFEKCKGIHDIFDIGQKTKILGTIYGSK
jgi:hypothetical protein